MSLLSLDILEGKTSKYETNHIHMIVDGDISFPVTNMNDKQYGTFFHEYIHYPPSAFPSSIRIYSTITAVHRSTIGAPRPIPIFGAATIR